MPMPRKYFTEEEKKQGRKEVNKKYREQHPDRVRRSNKNYFEKNKIKIRKKNAALNRKRRAENPEKARARDREYEETPRRKASKKEYARTHRKELNEKTRRNYLKRKDHYDELRRKNRKENAEHYNAYRKEWEKQNPEKVKAKGIRYRKKNPGKVAVWNARKMASEIKRTPKWANLKAIDDIYYNRPKGMSVDHIIPLNGKNVSGLHVEYNLRYLTRNENSKKGNKFNFDEYKLTKHYKDWIKKINKNLEKMIKKGGV